MINNDNENSTDTVMTESKTISSDDNNSKMSPTANSNGELQSVQNINNDLNENESQDNQLVVVQKEEQEVENDDEFIRITAAHQMLTEAQTYDEQKNYPAALHLYRICVDLLLEELMFTEGTDQSRIYLREKCTAIMDRIDSLKTMLEPIPPAPPTPPLPITATDEQTPTTTDEQTIPTTAELTTPTTAEQTIPTTAELTTPTTAEQTTTTAEQTINPPTDELNSLQLS